MSWPEDWYEKIAEAQTLTHVITADGKTYKRLAYGPDSPGLRLRLLCGGCDVVIGQLHVVPCMWEVCAVCQGQAFGCACLTGSEVVVSH